MLEELVESVRSPAVLGAIHPFPLDYGDDVELSNALARAIQDQGPIELVVSWIHSSAPNASSQIMCAVGQGPHVCRYFDVKGSAWANRDCAPDPSSQCGHLTWLRHRVIILGFVAEDGISRWLTHPEICRGVLDAIDRDTTRSIASSRGPHVAFATERRDAHSARPNDGSSSPDSANRSTSTMRARASVSRYPSSCSLEQILIVSEPKGSNENRAPISSLHQRENRAVGAVQSVTFSRWCAPDDSNV